MKKQFSREIGNITISGMKKEVQEIYNQIVNREAEFFERDREIRIFRRKIERIKTHREFKEASP